MKSIAIIFLTICLNNAFAESFILSGRKLELPLDKKWLAKSPSKDSLVFFDSSRDEPRLIISVYLAPFIYPRTSKDVSEFEATYLTKKVEWLKTVEGEARVQPNFQYREKSLSIRIIYDFQFQADEFSEIVQFYECGDKDALALKIMIPKSVKFQENDQKLTKLLSEVNLCL